jgi:nucleotide-binding universal stress UspA family protein
LQLVSAYEPVSTQRLPRAARPMPTGLEWTVHRRAEVEATLQEAAGRARDAGVEASPHAREGDAADAILDVAEELAADLIVVGNKGMTGASASCSAPCPTRSPTTRRAR